MMITPLLAALSFAGAGKAPLAARPRALSRMVATPIPMVPTAAPTTVEALAPEDQWVRKVDLDAFRADVMALGRRLKDEQGEEDVKHLRKIVMWSNACGLVGVLTSVLPLNPVSVIALSLWTFSRWTMIAHHSCHGGYNGHSERFASQRFAVGSLANRARDWLDWMLPEAWNVEHNNLHHYRLGEAEDPDLVERNLALLRSMPLPLPVKRVAVAGIASVWKWFYYAPNTFKQLKLSEARRRGEPLPEGVDEHAALTVNGLFAKDAGVDPWEFLGKVMLPYAFIHFVLLPLPVVAAGAALGFPAMALAGHAAANLVLADVLSNLHSFVVIATNHAGADLYRFDKGPARVNSGTWFMRQVVSSANFDTGGDLNDFMHGWLNYQIEHHVWPNLSMLSYQKSAPLLKEICDKHGVPYVQQNVFRRLGELTDIMIGKSSMRRYDPAWEKEEDFVAAA